MVIVTLKGKDVITGSFPYDKKTVNFNIPFSKEVYVDLTDIAEKINESTNFTEYEKWLNHFTGIVKEAEQAGNDPLITVPYIHLNPETKTYHIKLGKAWSILSIPETLLNVMRDSIELGITPTPIVNLIRRFMLNPKPTQERLDMLGFYVTQKFVDEVEVEPVAVVAVDGGAAVLACRRLGLVLPELGGVEGAAVGGARLLRVERPQGVALAGHDGVHHGLTAGA